VNILLAVMSAFIVVPSIVFSIFWLSLWFTKFTTQQIFYRLFVTAFMNLPPTRKTFIEAVDDAECEDDFFDTTAWEMNS
jgi:ABC-type phosphate transport system permease subunit